jgi:hypothetical protein
VDSFVGSTIQYDGTPTVQPVTFGTAAPITGVGLTGTFSALAGDLGGGSYPWSVDLAIDVTAPGGESFQWGPPIAGDVTIADFPIADGSGAGLSGLAGPGIYEFSVFDSFGGAGTLAEIQNPTYYATTTVPDVSFGYTASPDPSSSWDRPFFIDGVSGLGPVSFDAFEFTVTEAGVYEFTSVLSEVDDHFSFLYAGGFDSAQPLVNLMDYGLGNGNDPFGAPRGESSFSQLLFPGETYTWVTSQWSSFDPIRDASNTIVGPGVVIPAPATAVLMPVAAAGVAHRRRR